jgi:hypothetical protein
MGFFYILIYFYLIYSMNFKEIESRTIKDEKNKFFINHKCLYILIKWTKNINFLIDDEIKRLKN